jgi:hypothetical protein
MGSARLANLLASRYGSLQSDGGTNTFSNDIYLGYNPSGKGTYHLDGGTLLGKDFAGGGKSSATLAAACTVTRMTPTSPGA